MVSYRELRRLEIEVMKELYDPKQQQLDVNILSLLTVNQFYGIEIKRIEKQKTRTDNALVFCGLILVNIATFPSLFNVLVYGSTPPPASLTGLVMCGLFFYMARAIRNYRTEWVYAVGEFIGICSNGFLFVYALTV